MVGKSVKNANEIRAYIKACTLLGSKDIYADTWAVYGSNEMSFYTVCRWVRKFSADMVC